MIETIKDYFANIIESDKLLHFFYGFIGFWLLAVIFNIWISFGIVLLIAAANEYYFWKYEGGKFSKGDIIFSIVPAILFILLTFFL
jgi:hypothetical protein